MQKKSDGYVVLGTPFDVDPQYEILGPIGQGAYGVVVAAKVKNSDDTDSSCKAIQREGFENEDTGAVSTDSYNNSPDLIDNVKEDNSE